LARRGLIGAKRKIGDDCGARRAAFHCFGVHHHHVKRDAQRVVHAVQHHADGIADQQCVDMRIEQARDRCGVGSQDDDWLAPLRAASSGIVTRRVGLVVLNGICFVAGCCVALMAAVRQVRGRQNLAATPNSSNAILQCSSPSESNVFHFARSFASPVGPGPRPSSWW